MTSAVNAVVIVFRLISCVISFALVGWFIVYLRRRMEFQEIFRKKFLLATIILGISGGLTSIPGALILSCISSQADTTNFVLTFLQTLFLAFTMYGHTVALYIRSCDIIDAKTKRIIRYLIFFVFISSLGVLISAFILIFVPSDESLVPFDPVRCKVRNPAEIYLGFVIGASVVAADSIFMYNFVQYLQKTKKILGNTQSDVLGLISEEAVKILVLNYVGFIGFAMYEFLPGDVGTVLFLIFDYCVVAGLFLWIRLKYWLDQRESRSKSTSHTHRSGSPLKSSSKVTEDQNYLSTSRNPTKAHHSSQEALSSSIENRGDKSQVNVSMNESLNGIDTTPESDQIP